MKTNVMAKRGLCTLLQRNGIIERTRKVAAVGGAYSARDSWLYWFHVPGHKGRYIPQELSAAWGQDVFNYDLTELPGLTISMLPWAQSKSPGAGSGALRCALYLFSGGGY